jgi:uncharacterized membrane protein
MIRGMTGLANSLKKPSQDLNKIFKHHGVTSCLLIFGLATLVMLPIFGHGLPPAKDAVVHYRWAAGFIDALGEGSLYPQWLGNPNSGAGSPAMLYYPSLPFYVEAGFYLVTGNVLKALALGCWLALALSGITTYVFARSVLSHRVSLLAAVLYLLAPYHLLDLYQRAALSEFWAFVSAPLVLYAIHRVASGGDWRAVTLLAVGYGLLLLTHVLTAFATTLILPIYVVFLTRDWRRIAKSVAGVALGVGLSAIFVAPLILERDYVRLHRIHTEKFTRSFLIENLPAAFKAVPLPPGREPEFFYQNPDYFYYEANMVIFILLFALISILIWKRRQTDRQNDSQPVLFRAIWIVTLFGLFMTTRLSEPIWRIIPGLPYMQFPIRWLLLASTGMSLLSAAAFSLAMARRGRSRTAYGSVIVLLLALNLIVATFAVVRQQRGEQAIPKEVSGLEVPEYRPRSWNYKDSQESNIEAVVVSNGEANVQAIDETGARQTYAVSAVTESLLRFRTLYFPGWVGRVDGHPVEIGPSELGNIQLSIEPGEHQLTLSFEDTWPRIAGKLISALCVLVTLTMLYCTRRRSSAPAGMLI